MKTTEKEIRLLESLKQKTPTRFSNVCHTKLLPSCVLRCSTT